MKCGACSETINWKWRYCPFCSARLGRVTFTRAKSGGRGTEQLITACGRLVDYRGNPVEAAGVSLMQVTTVREGKSGLTNANHWNIPGWDSDKSVVTDEEGYFAISFGDFAANRLRKYGLLFQIPWKYPASGIKGENIRCNPAPAIIDLTRMKGGRIDIGTLVAQKGGAISIKLTDENNDCIRNDVYILIFKDRETSGDGGQISGIEDGIFISDAYPPGAYGVKIAKDRYKTWIRRGIVVHEGRVTDVIARLERMIEL